MAKRATRTVKVDAASNVVRHQFAGDSMINLVSGIGTERSKSYHTTYAFFLLDKITQEAAYRGDWIARKIVDAPAEDSVREWREWQAEGDQIQLIEDLETALCVPQKMLRCMKLARLYGGAALVMGVAGAGDASTELVLDRVQRDSLKFVHVVSMHELTAQQAINDLESPWFGHPRTYTRTVPGEAPVEIHPSRVVRLIGREIPDPTTTPQLWGDSVLQAVDDAVRAAGMVSGGIAELVQEAKIDIIRMPGLQDLLSTEESTARLTRRFTASNRLKSMINTLLMDKQEEWQRVQASFASLPDVLKMYLLIAAGAADIPATRLLGQSATGFNATGENDIRNYYDRVASDQNMTLTPAMRQLDEVLIRSATGGRDEQIFYEWVPLWQLDELQKADLAHKKAGTFQIDLNAGLINPDALREARINQLIEDGTYPGLEIAIEEHGAEPPEADDEEILAAFQELQGRQKQLFPNADPKKAITGPAKDARFQDATPRTLYVRRDLINVDEVREWASSQGFETVVPDMHVTVCYSRTAVDWTKIGEDYNQDEQGRQRVAPGGARLVEPLGDRGAIVLLFSSSRLSWRHHDFMRAGASWDYDDYQPHLTITYAGSDVDLDTIEPYRGELVLGPEIFEEIDNGGFSPPEEVES